MNPDDKKKPYWKCLESRVDSKRLYYGRFGICPLKKGQAQTIGFIIRRILLGELEAASIAYAKFDKMLHEFSYIDGIIESIHEILMNLKEIVFRTHSSETLMDAYIYVKGPGNVTAQDIIFSTPFVKIVDNTQHIASLRKPIDLRIELRIERRRGYREKQPQLLKDGSFLIDGVGMPVLNVNFNIFNYGEDEDKELLVLEIWTNGSLTPKEALRKASRTLINFYIPCLIDLQEENLDFEEQNLDFEEQNLDLEDKNNPNFLKHVFLDQLNINTRVYNYLKRYDINTVWDLVYTSTKELMEMKGFVIEDLTHIKKILEDILKTL